MNPETKAVVEFGPSPVAAPTSLLHLIWPAAIIALGLVLSAGWTGLVGYGLFELARRVL